jgi:hypothetical protein
VAISHDAAEFAVNAIQRWWEKPVRKRFPTAKHVLVSADCGGSNSPRTRLWRLKLQRLANETGRQVGLCNFPPGTSKWNEVKHCLFCHVQLNIRDHPVLIQTNQLMVMPRQRVHRNASEKPHFRYFEISVNSTGSHKNPRRTAAA